MSDLPIRVLIRGTGAMACLFAARLAAIGVQVIMLGTWEKGLRALEQRGVRLVNSAGEETAFPVQVVSSPDACKGIKYALVLVKSWQTKQAAEQLALCLHQEGIALTLQNGINNHQTLEQALGPDRVALGITTSGATMLEPGYVRPVGTSQVSLGEHKRIEPLTRLLQKAGFDVDLVTDTSSLLWGKLVINAAINPLTALLRVPNGLLLDRPTARALLGSTAREVASVAAGLGIELPYLDPVAAVETVAQRTGANFSSMLQDIQRGFPTEVDAINGAVVQAGEVANIPTPQNRTLWQLIKAIECGSLNIS